MELNQEQLSKLRQSDSSIPVFSLTDKSFIGKVVDIYDGDTCRINLFLQRDELSQFAIRMNGYDCPEKRTKDDAEKHHAMRARDALVQLIDKKVVMLKCDDMDKYGRVLGTIFVPQEGSAELLNVNQWMIANRLGTPYGGKTKESFQDLLKGGYYTETPLTIPKTRDYM
jgi:endonuclease YncB( thermonuclease family)